MEEIAAGIFGRSGRKPAEVGEETVRSLHAEIGELAVANDFLSRKLKPWTGKSCGIGTPLIIERLWRSLKYEGVCLRTSETGSQAKAAIGRWVTFFNPQRPHIAHGGLPPAMVYFNSIKTDQQAQAAA